MKGTPEQPQCGFSMTVSNILKMLEINFKGVNVLADEKVDVKVTEAYSGVLEDMVRTNKLEFAIVPSVKNPTGLNIEFVSSDLNFLVTKKSSEFEHLKPIKLSKLDKIKI